mgnify:CR=1 FL=1
MFVMVRDRLVVTAAGRLARVLQVLIQAKKTGRDLISSQELGQYTNIGPTQIRRDLSGLGKFGQRGVGYNVDFLIGEIRSVLRSAGQHNIVLVGAGLLKTPQVLPAPPPRRNRFGSHFC